MTTRNMIGDATRMLARLLTSVIFVTSGIAKIRAWDANIAYIATRSVPFKPVLLAVALCIELGGAACLVTGFRTKIAAWTMFFYMVFVTVKFHRFGSVDYQKNLGIMGALLMLAVCGAGAWAIDSAFNKKEKQQ